MTKRNNQFAIKSILINIVIICVQKGGNFFMAQDRRIRKTRNILKHSLIALMKEKSVKHITVKELCEKADINRGTFYLHYKDVYDMFEQTENEFFNELTAVLENSRKNGVKLKDTNLEPLFSFLLENKDFCMVMLSPHGDMSFTRQLLHYLHERIVTLYGKESAKMEHYYFFVIYGCVGLISNWLNTNAKETPQERAQLAEDVILSGIKKYL